MGTITEDKLQALVSDKELENAFGNSDFGEKDKRVVLKHILLKFACSYSTGHSAKSIAFELGLITSKNVLSVKGKEYLFDAFCDGYSY